MTDKKAEKSDAVEKEDLKENLVLWWHRKASKTQKGWSFPCIITELNENGFKLASLETFEELRPLFSFEGNVLHELSYSSRKQIEMYIIQKRKWCSKEAERLEREVALERSKINTCNQFLKKIRQTGGVNVTKPIDWVRSFLK
jgi:hypothetical protein